GLHEEPFVTPGQGINQTVTVRLSPNSARNELIHPRPPPHHRFAAFPKRIPKDRSPACDPQASQRMASAYIKTRDN
ncbi:MAG: hypothetical protein ACN6QI_18010, partial [Pseudomonas sp.]|uniref:hypothetical protein n=1 Tax=Pseudomonas sp. TaxID=306 RepID=UPI003D142494